MTGIVRKLRLGIIGLVVSALFGTAAIAANYRTEAVRDLRIYASWCGLKSEPSPKCLEERKKESSYEKSVEFYEEVNELFAASSGFTAFVSGSFIAFVLMRIAFIHYVLPASRKLKADYEINQAVKRIEKYERLRDTGVLTQAQYDQKVRELKASIAD